jgi:hypothetical protein
MLHVLKEWNGQVCVVFVDTSWDEPIVIRRWFPTGVNAHVARQGIGHFENEEVRPDRSALSGGTYVLPSKGFGARGVVTLDHFGETESERTDKIPVPRPRTRLKGKVSWEGGEWRIHGAKGDQLLASVDLSKYLEM